MNFVDCVIDGGWGNRLCKWAFARAYADRVGATLRTTYWEGCELFGLDAGDSSVIGTLDRVDNLDFEKWDGRTNIQITGEAQHQKHLIYTREQAMKWFKLKPEYEEAMKDIPRLPVAAHLRWGDFVGHDGFIAIEKESYLAAAIAFGIDPDSIVFVSPEAPTRVKGWNPSWGFIPDFLSLSRADILFRGPSTFSWWAGVLGTHRRIFSPQQRGVPHSGTNRGFQDVPFIEGNHMPITAWWEGHSELHLRER